MVFQFLVPGVKHLDYSGSRTKIFLISRKLQKSFGAAFMEKSVKKSLVAVKQRVKFVRERKNDMKVWRIYHFCLTLVNPDLFVHSLTVRAAAVPA